MICSNGFSEKLLAFVLRGNKYLESCGHFPKDTFHFFSRSKDRKKLLYLHTEFEVCNNTLELLANIAKRRNLCIDMTSADYVFMLDADAKLLDVKMFKEINRKLEKTHRAMRMYKTLHEIGVLPVFPIGYARIDQLNLCVKAELAKKVRYPTTVDKAQIGNDFYYYVRVSTMCHDDYSFINKIFAQHNGNNRYENILKLRERESHV